MSIANSYEKSVLFNKNMLFIPRIELCLFIVYGYP